MWEFFLNSFVILLVVVDPIMVVPAFASLTPHNTHGERRRLALKATLIATIILLVFVFLGTRLLHALSISMPAFRVAGGVLLFLVAIDMVFARHSGVREPTATEHQEATSKEDISVFPLAIPLIAGPGAITTVLLLSTSAHGQMVPYLIVLAVVLLVMGTTLSTLLMSGGVMRILGETGANVIGRVFGLVLAGLSVQFVIDGIRASFF